MRPLISADELARLLDDQPNDVRPDDVRVVDVRWALLDPDHGRRAYAAGHLPGAVFLDLDEDLSAPEGPGRHPLPDPDRFAARLSEVGIGDRHLVVAYDDAGGGIAARLWWLLRHLGHHRVQVLDGGIQAWTDAGFDLTTEPPSHPRATFHPRPRRGDVIDRETLADRLGEFLLVDARDPARYRGEEEPVDPVAGHIPTAVNLPWKGNLAADGRFRPTFELAERFRSAGADREPTVVYCGSGVTACHDILAMVHAGLPEPVLYPGSWSDWATAAGPIAVGPAPGEPPGEPSDGRDPMSDPDRP